jgi:hypothetical protein
MVLEASMLSRRDFQGAPISEYRRKDTVTLKMP